MIAITKRNICMFINKDTEILFFEGEVFTVLGEVTLFNAEYLVVLYEEDERFLHHPFLIEKCDCKIMLIDKSKHYTV